MLIINYGKTSIDYIQNNICRIQTPMRQSLVTKMIRVDPNFIECIPNHFLLDEASGTHRLGSKKMTIGCILLIPRKDNPYNLS